MTNLQSVAGGSVWVAVAAILMLITFEPVSVEKQPGALEVAAETTATTSPAA